MSVCSSGRVLTPSILKQSSIHGRLKFSNSATKVRFVLPHSKNIRNIFKDYLKNKNSREYQNLVCLIRDSELTDDDLSSLLEEAVGCISMLNHELRFFIEVVLTVKWVTRETKVVKEYQSFLNNLLVAHPCHVKIVIDHLVTLFSPEPDEEAWKNGDPSSEDVAKFSKVHKVIKNLFKIVPMCKEVIMDSLNSRYPYIKRGVHANDCYLYNALKILDYEQSFKAEVLNIIFSRLVKMDVNLPREFVEKVYSKEEEVFMLEDSEACAGVNQESSDDILVATLDACLKRIFKFIQKECHDEDGNLDWDKTKAFYKMTLKLFDGLILPTYNSHYIQFCWFVLLSFKPCLAESFIEHLWKKVTDPSLPSVIRQTSVQYIASLVARATYVNLRLLKNVLQQFSSWIHMYINAQDDVETVNLNLKVHSVFYSTCQALFYTTFFRHKEMIASNKNISFLQSLNFPKIITCRLNPLRVCQPAVVQNFAAFTRNYQLAYCHAIIEHNSRSTFSTIYQSNSMLQMAQTNDVLEANYPFDPFVLQLSGETIKPLYKIYEEFDLKETKKEESMEDGEDDDFIDHSYVSSKRMKFSYGSSPGFKFNT